MNEKASQIVLHKPGWEVWGGGEETRKEMILNYGFEGITLLGISRPDENQIPQTAYDWLPINPTKLLGRNFLSMKEMNRINKELLNLNPQVTIFDQPTSITDLIFLSRLSSEIKRKSVIFWGNDILSLGLNRPYIFRAAKNRSIAKIANSVALNLGESDQVLKSLETVGVQKNTLKKILVPIVPNSVETEILLDRNEFLDEDQLGVIFVSRLAKEKNLMILPKLLEELQNRMQHITLPKNSLYKRIGVNLIGPEQDQEIIEMIQVIQEQFQRKNKGMVSFTYHGRKTPHALQGIYPHHSFVVMPATTEGFGRVTVEAMRYGLTPIVNAQCGASVEVAGGAGKLSQDENFATETADYIVQGLLHPELLKENEDAAKRRSQDFTIAAAKDTFLKVLRENGLLK